MSTRLVLQILVLIVLFSSACFARTSLDEYDEQAENQLLHDIDNHIRDESEALEFHDKEELALLEDSASVDADAFSNQLPNDDPPADDALVSITKLTDLVARLFTAKKVKNAGHSTTDLQKAVYGFKFFRAELAHNLQRYRNIPDIAKAFELLRTFPEVENADVNTAAFFRVLKYIAMSDVGRFILPTLKTSLKTLIKKIPRINESPENFVW